MNSDHKLQSAYRSATLSCPLGGDGCPSAEEIAATARGTLDAAQRERMLAILGNCARCAALVQVAGELDAPEPIAPPPRVRRPARWWGAGIAAALALAAVLVVRPPMPGPTRGVGEAVEPAPDARLTGAPSRFAWAAPEGVACRVTVRSAAAEIVLQSESILDGRYEPDASARARLTDGDYLWTADCGASRHGPYAFSIAR